LNELEDAEETEEEEIPKIAYPCGKQLILYFQK
jgi:hypothetical protein